MNRIIALSLVAFSVLLVHPYARAAEGKVAEPSPALDENRTANYSGATQGEPASAKTIDPKKSRLPMHINKSVASRVSRPAATSMSARFSDFYFYDATSTLRSDRDGDGYHSEFRVRFDADVIVGDAYVYARLYLRRAGESEWFLYHETDDFYINGQSPVDEYYVTTTLDDGYPTGEYDVLIDLYESGYSGIVATIGPLDSGALSYLPLEEVGLDVPLGIAGYSIGDVSTALITDADLDGYYSRFRITFDPDADFDSRVVYARIWVRARGGEWIEDYATEDFWVEASGQADAYVLDVEWRNGYPTSFYDVQIDLHDSATDLLVASAGSERPSLAQIPLEDQSQDQYVSPPVPGSGGSTSSREGGGGAFGFWSLIGLLMLGLAKRRRCRGLQRDPGRAESSARCVLRRHPVDAPDLTSNHSVRRLLRRSERMYACRTDGCDEKVCLRGADATRKGCKKAPTNEHSQFHQESPSVPGPAFLTREVAVWVNQMCPAHVAFRRREYFAIWGVARGLHCNRLRCHIEAAHIYIGSAAYAGNSRFLK